MTLVQEKRADPLMINRITCCREKGTDPFRNLAVEKYLTLHAMEGECILYLWQNRKTVVIGRNQNAWKECGISDLEADGGHLVRRLSGGGAVYHDLGNLNFTFCVRKEDYDVSRQLTVILDAVRRLGILAEMSGRNDLLAAGRKFSGNAFYRSGDFCCHHGTLMLDVDGEKLARYLHVPEEKLRGKGVDSVRSRVVNLKELCPEITVELLCEKLTESFSQGYGLPVKERGPEDLYEKEEVRQDTEMFASWEWRFGRKIPFTHRVSGRFPWGELSLLLEVEDGRIRDCVCYSDAMEQELIGRLPARLKGRRYDGNELDVACALLDSWRKSSGAADGHAGGWT